MRRRRRFGRPAINLHSGRDLQRGLPFERRDVVGHCCWIALDCVGLESLKERLVVHWERPCYLVVPHRRVASAKAVAVEWGQWKCNAP